MNYDKGFADGYIAALEWCRDNVKGDSPYFIIQNRIDEYNNMTKKRNNMTHKCIKEQAIKIAREATGYLPADDERVKTIMRGAIKMAEWLLDHAWHNSNKEQPDGSSMVVAIHIDGSGSVHQFTNIFPNMKWAYLDDLRLEKQQTRR